MHHMSGNMITMLSSCVVEASDGRYFHSSELLHLELLQGKLVLSCHSHYCSHNASLHQIVGHLFSERVDNSWHVEDFIPAFSSSQLLFHGQSLLTFVSLFMIVERSRDAPLSSGIADLPYILTYGHALVPVYKKTELLQPMSTTEV